MRLQPELRERLREAARSAHVTESELIREAITRRCDDLLADRLDRRLADVIGTVSIGGGYSRRSHEAFFELLLADQRHRRRQ